MPPFLSFVDVPVGVWIELKRTRGSWRRKREKKKEE